MWSAYVAQSRLMPFGGDEWEVETIEQRRELQLPSCTLSFQIDRLLRNGETGELALVDLKTASRTDSRWQAQWPRSLQMKLYAVCIAQTYGQPLQWLIIEGLAKDKPGVTYVALPDISAEKRTEAVQAVEWVAKHDQQVLDVARQSDGSINVNNLAEYVLNESPFNPGECWSYNSPCPYLPLCDAEPSERAALLRADYHYEQPKHLV
jgi:hypothetical protein